MATLTSTGYRTAILGGTAFVDIFKYGCIEVRTGPQPATADDAATGTLIARITADGGAWTAGSPTNGLRFLQDGPRIVNDPVAPWVLKGEATGEAGWFRLVGNAPDDGQFSLTAPRIDGTIGLLSDTTDIQLFLPTVSITPATSIVVPYWWYGLPPL